LRFTKMNGAGNDFLVINNIEEKLDHALFPTIAKTLCHRHLSIGADGLMVVESSASGCDFQMLFYNSDGSIGEMCGNGARCICRYGFDRGLSGEEQTVETTSGIVRGRRIDQRNYRIRLTDPSVIKTDLSIKALGEDFSCAYVELGVPGLPHAAVFYPGLKDKTMEEMRQLGKTLRWHSAFPKGANINFYDITGEDELVELTYERGVEDFTYACGTGTGSVVLVLTLLGKVSGKNVRVSVPGGQLQITVEGTAPDVTGIWLTGPTNTVCEGVVTDEDLSL